MRRTTRLPVRVLDALAMRFANSGSPPRAVYVGDLASTPPPKTPPPEDPAVLSEIEVSAPGRGGKAKTKTNRHSTAARNPARGATKETEIERRIRKPER